MIGKFERSLGIQCGISESFTSALLRHHIYKYVFGSIDIIFKKILKFHDTFTRRITRGNVQIKLLNSLLPNCDAFHLEILFREP